MNQRRALRAMMADAAAARTDVASAVAGDGETIILSIRPSPLFILLAPLGPIALVVFLTLVARQVILITNAPLSTANILNPAAALIAARIVWQAFDWGCRSYVLTDRRIIRTYGVLRRDTFEAPLRSLTHLELRRSALERVFGLGTIGINTAGTAFTEAWWLSVAQPESVMRTIREAVERYGRTG